MKRSFVLIALFVLLFLLSACAAQAATNAWTTYHAASDTLVNPNFPSYSFEYPAYWQLQESANHIAFASEARLLESPPEKMSADQILAGLSLNTNMSPEEMVTSYTSTLDDALQFEEVALVRLNGREAASQQGTNPETGDMLYVLAVDVGENTRALITARMAGEEFTKWESVLLQMAGSLQIDQ